MFSEKDREIMQEVRGLFSNNGKQPDYYEPLSGIVLAVKGNFEIHKLLIACIDKTLIISTVDYLPAKGCSAELFKYILHINQKITDGCFYYSERWDGFGFRINCSVVDNPLKDLLFDRLGYAASVLDLYIPEIFLHTFENICEGKTQNPTYH